MEKKVLGVCVWLANKLNADVAMVRLGFILAVLLFGTGIFAYLVIFLLLQFGILD